MSYGPNAQAVVRRTATYGDRILKGTKSGDLLEQAEQLRAESSTSVLRSQNHCCSGRIR